MLVLTRKANEAIVIGNVTITVLRIDGGQIRLGIEAPREVTVLRKEVAERLKKEGEHAGD
jgi:carbon storage regulator